MCFAWHAGAVVINAEFYKSKNKNILFEICKPHFLFELPPLHIPPSRKISCRASCFDMSILDSDRLAKCLDTSLRESRLQRPAAAKKIVEYKSLPQSVSNQSMWQHVRISIKQSEV